jgi:hypothetical protein
MNSHPTSPTQRRSTSHSSLFQMLLVAVALLGSLVSSEEGSGARG